MQFMRSWTVEISSLTKYNLVLVQNINQHSQNIVFT